MKSQDIVSCFREQRQHIWKKSEMQMSLLLFLVALQQLYPLPQSKFCKNKYYRKCKLFKSFTKNLPPPKFTGKNELPTPCWKNWNSFDWYAGCFNFAFPRAAIKQFLNWPMIKMFWNAVWNLPFFLSRSMWPHIKSVFDGTI